MPYVRGGTSQGDSNQPEIIDVYHSNNVYANSVAIALWQPPGATGTSSPLVIKIPSSNLFSRPDTPPASDPPQVYKPPAKPPTRQQNEQAGTAPKNPGAPETPPIQDQPESKCDGGKPSVEIGRAHV